MGGNPGLLSLHKVDPLFGFWLIQFYVVVKNLLGSLSFSSPLSFSSLWVLY